MIDTFDDYTGPENPNFQIFDPKYVGEVHHGVVHIYVVQEDSEGEFFRQWIAGRKMSKYMCAYYDVCIAYGTDDPLAHAIWLTTRQQNDSGMPTLNMSLAMMKAGYSFVEDTLRRVCSVQSETLARWKKHYLNGGSLKALRYTEDEWSEIRASKYRKVSDLINKERRENRAKRKTFNAMLKRMAGDGLIFRCRITGKPHEGSVHPCRCTKSEDGKLIFTTWQGGTAGSCEFLY